LKLNIERKILIAISRTIIQLLLAGYVLLSFIFSMSSPFWVFLYLVGQVSLASLEASSRTDYTYIGHFKDSAIVSVIIIYLYILIINLTIYYFYYLIIFYQAVVAGGAIMGLFGAIIIYDPSPWFNPHIVIPTAGMLIGNAISGISIYL
jgi:putative ABC transport system permease protein